MATTPLAGISDVEAIWRPLTDAETVVCSTRIDQASRLLRRRVQQLGGGSIDDLVTAGSLTAGDVADVVAEIVKRAMSMPGYVKQQSITIDAATKSTTFDNVVSGRGGVFITDDEVYELLGPMVRLYEIQLSDI